MMARIYNQFYGINPNITQFDITFDVPLTINSNFYPTDKNIEYNVEIDKTVPQAYVFESENVLKYTIELQMVNEADTNKLYTEYLTQSKYSLYTFRDHKGNIINNLDFVNLSIKPQKVDKLGRTYYTINMELAKNMNE